MVFKDNGKVEDGDSKTWLPVEKEKLLRFLRMSITTRKHMGYNKSLNATEA